MLASPLPSTGPSPGRRDRSEMGPPWLSIGRLVAGPRGWEPAELLYGLGRILTAIVWLCLLPSHSEQGAPCILPSWQPASQPGPSCLEGATFFVLPRTRWSCHHHLGCILARSPAALDAGGRARFPIACLALELQISKIRISRRDPVIPGSS